MLSKQVTPSVDLADFVVPATRFGYFEGSHWRLHFSCMASSKTDVGSIYLGKFHHDLTVLPHWNHGLYTGNHPQMAELFRLVKYYNLPIYIYNVVPVVFG